MARYIYTIVLLMAAQLLIVGCGQKAAFAPAAQAESFSQKVVWNNKVDIVWMVDNSSSMGQHQARIANQINYFFDALQSSGFDFHIGVTTSDMSPSGEQGRFIGSPKVITNGTGNLRQALANNILAAGETGSNLERGFEGVKSALSTRLNTDNAGFYRPDAILALIFLSDEDDQSGGSVGDYINFLNAFKPDFPNGYKGWIASFIGVTELTSNCRTYNDYAAPGNRYMSLADYSGGVSSTICTADFSSALTSLRSRIIEIVTEYRLRFAPDLATLKVYVNGHLLAQDATNGWTYDPNGYVVRFHGTGVPPIDAEVNIDYKPLNKQ